MCPPNVAGEIVRVSSYRQWLIDRSSLSSSLSPSSSSLLLLLIHC
jgi:hypothetical protein